LGNFGSEPEKENWAVNVAKMSNGFIYFVRIRERVCGKNPDHRIS
jgi:hypothetical protein